MSAGPRGFGRRESARYCSSIEDAAAEWIARRDAGLSPSESAEFERWIAADSRHAAALAELDAAWLTMNRPREAGRSGTVMRHIAGLKRAAARRHSQWTTAGGLTLAAAAAVFLGFRLFPGAGPLAESSPIPTVMLRPDRQVLPDGSTVELNSGAEIEVSYSDRRRGVRLLKGEALFSVVKDPSRPFVVTAADVAVRAIGTAFAIHFDTTQVDVLVTEGRVAVERVEDGGSQPDRAEQFSPANPFPLTSEAPVLSAGHRLVVPVANPLATKSAVAALTDTEMADALSWRHRRVEFSSTSLTEAVVLFNQANRVQLVLADAATAGLEISGVFWTDDPEGFARLLESSLGVAAKRNSADRIVLKR